MSTHESGSGDPDPGRDEWGRNRHTEPERDFPPRHRAIELTSMSDSEEGFSMYHPDTLEDGDQTWIWTPDETLVMSIEKCR